MRHALKEIVPLVDWQRRHLQRNGNDVVHGAHFDEVRAGTQEVDDGVNLAPSHYVEVYNITAQYHRWRLGSGLLRRTVAYT